MRVVAVLCWAMVLLLGWLDTGFEMKGEVRPYPPHEYIGLRIWAAAWLVSGTVLWAAGESLDVLKRHLPPARSQPKKEPKKTPLITQPMPKAAPAAPAKPKARDFRVTDADGKQLIVRGAASAQQAAEAAKSKLGTIAQVDPI